MLTSLAVVVVGQVALVAAVAGQVVFPNALVSTHHGAHGDRVPIQIHEDAALSNFLDAIHDHPNTLEPMPGQDLVLELSPSGQGASVHGTSVQEPIHIQVRPVAEQSPIYQLSRYREHLPEEQEPKSIYPQH
jgi:hypothetical protein